MKVYLAGPMTGYPNLNFPLFHSEAARLRAMGYVVVNPAEINADPNAEWAACLRNDIRALIECAGIVLLPGYSSSRGALLEIYIAKALGMARMDAHLAPAILPSSVETQQSSESKSVDKRLV